MRSQEYYLTDHPHNFILKTYHSSLLPQTRNGLEHHHTECELSVFLKGKGVYAVHGTEYPFSAGDVFLFGSNEAHSIREVHEEMELLNVHFEPRLLWECAETVELLNLFAARSDCYSHRFCNDGVLGEKICHLEQELIERKVGFAVNCKYFLFSALVHILRHYGCVDPEKALRAHSSTFQSLQKSIDYIHENIHGKLTLKEIAAQACMTPTYFSTVFKKYHGVSPWEYIKIKRVETAIGFLRRTDLTRLEIAEHCGFSCTSAMYKALLSVTGKKPGDFRKKSNPS